ncbi:TrkH family potassium uptake protein [Thauera sp. WH-1]|uniref:TrkH family potassium uptake protein n=1 Tax=Thauera sp. WH-1 TaxID=3398230 RepID=UPI0039FCC054
MADRRLDTLRHAVRWPVLLRHLGMLGVVLATLNGVPLVATVIWGEPAQVAAYALPLLALLAISLPLARLAAPERLQLNEALAVVVLAFVLGSLVMSIPLAQAVAGTPGGSLGGWLDGWFEAVSAITSTGLSTAATVEDKPASFLFARAWMQWYGGLGIVVLSLALFLHNGMFARQLMETEAVGETLVSSTKAYARRMLAVYVVLTLSAVGGLWLATGDGFVALTHGLSAVSTGGFSTFDASVAGWSRLAAATALLFSLLGAVSLPLWHRAWQQGWKQGWREGWRRGPAELGRDPELRLLLVATLTIAGLLWLWAPAGEGRAADALLLAMSAQSTTGFAPANVAALDDASKLTLIASMLVGGSVGSTAGGFKLLRLLILLRLLQLVLARAAAPRHAVLGVHLQARQVADEDLWRVLLVVLLFVGLAFVSWLAFVAHGYPALDALFEVVSASATVGLSTGIARPELEPVLKLVLCLAMLAGRLEILALLVLLHPGTWFGKRTEVA